MGYITVFFTFILHPLVRWICKRIDGLMKLIFCDIYYFAEFFGAVNAWRGIWILLDVYLYPGKFRKIYLKKKLFDFYNKLLKFSR